MAPRCAPHATDASRDSGGPRDVDRRARAAVAPSAALRLVIAGHILQRRGHRIVCQSGEAYPLAVQRVMQGLSSEKRQQIENEVEFLVSLGPDGLPSDELRRRWRNCWPL